MLGCIHIAGRAGATIVLLVSCAGCALQSYRAAPLDAAASAQRFEARTLDSPALREYLLAHCHSAQAWPIERWGLTELIRLAFHDHPELELARAQAKAARAEGAVATQRPPLAITPRVEHHSLRSAAQSSPWNLGFEVQVSLSVASTGEAVRDRYDAFARAAELKIGTAAWDVRSRVRSRPCRSRKSSRDRCRAARRAVEAGQFRALQDKVIVQAQGAEAAYESLPQAEQVNAPHLNRVQQVERHFEGGDADRVELTAARLDMLLALRAAFALRIETLRAQGALEGALQIALTGGPLPQLAGTASGSATGLAQQ